MTVTEINRMTIQSDDFMPTQLACIICPIHPALLPLINHRLSTSSTHFRSTYKIRIMIRNLGVRKGNPQATPTIGIGASHLTKRPYTEVTQKSSRGRALLANLYGPSPTRGFPHTHLPLHQFNIIQNHFQKQST